MKTSVYLTFVAVILLCLGAALITLPKDKSGHRQAVDALATPHIDINWGIGVDVSAPNNQPLA